MFSTKYTYAYFRQNILSEIASRINRPIRILDFSRFFLDIRLPQLIDILPSQIVIMFPTLFLSEIVSEQIFTEIERFKQRPNFIGVFLYDFITTEFGEKKIEHLKENGVKFKIVSSPTEVINLAKQHPELDYYLLAIGFEPLTALIAASILTAHREQIGNIHFLTELYQSGQFITPIYRQYTGPIDGIFIPGRIVAPLGYFKYENITRQRNIPVIITGTDIPDVLQAISMLLSQLEQKTTKLEIQYRPGIRAQGNPIAREKIESVFILEDRSWTNFGMIQQSRYLIKQEYNAFNA